MQKKHISSLFILLLSQLFVFIPKSCYPQNSQSFQLKASKISNVAGSIHSRYFKLNESDMGTFCVGFSSSDHFFLNGSMVVTTVQDSSLFRDANPSLFMLMQNYPNPFNPNTAIQYSLPKASDVVIKIFNSTGQLVRTMNWEFQSPGTHQVKWDAKDNNGKLLPSGVYTYQVVADNYSDARKMIFIK